MAEGFVADTDVVSNSFRGDTGAEPFRPFLASQEVAISFMTMAELDLWALSRKWGARRQTLLAEFLDQFIVVMADRDLCRVWATVVGQTRADGRPIPASDAWIAATAISLGVPLLTHNRAHFAGVAGLIVLPEQLFI